MTDSRAKGAGFERTVAKALELELGIKFRRDLQQYQQADRGDLVTDCQNWPYVVECKRYAEGTGCKPAWWKQAKTAADKAGKIPIVIYQYDRRQIRCVLPLSHLIECTHEYLVEVDFQTFCYIAREKMND